MAFIKEIQTPDNIKHQIKNTIIPVVGTQTKSTGNWTGNIDLPELYDGLTIAYFLPWAPSGNATLNLTLSDGSQTGAINCYYNINRLTTHYGKATNIIMTYWSAGSISIEGSPTTDDRWIAQADYDSNSIGYHVRRIYSNLKAGPNKIFPYTMIMQNADGRWESLVTSSTVNSTKTRNTHGFRLGQVLLMYANATYNADALVGAYYIWSMYSELIDHRYDFNTENNATKGTIGYKPIYLVGTINNTDGLFYLDETWWTQTLPSTDDGKIYIYIGDAYDYYRMNFVDTQKFYRYKNGALREISQDAITVNGHTVNKDVPSDAIFTDTTYSAGNGLTLTGTSFNVGKRWSAVSQGQKWSRLYAATPVVSTVGTSGFLNITATRGSVVVNASFLVTSSHASTNYVHITQIDGNNYTTIRVRGVAKSNGEYYFEIYDTAQGIASGTTQSWNCCFIPLADTTLTTYTTFTDGSTIPSGYSAFNDFTTTQYNDASAIKNISRSGTTFTATKQDGSTFTFDQQDDYLKLSGGTLTGNLVTTTTRIANTYYGISFGKTTTTPVETILYTGIKWVSSSHMPVIHITGYAYGLQSPVEFKIGLYIYNNKIGYCGVTNMGAWKPTVYLFKYTSDSVDYVAVGLAGSCYYLQLQADVQDEMGKFAYIVTDSSKWTWSFLTSTGTIPAVDDGTTCCKVPYKADILKDYYHTTGSWSGLTYTATNNGGVGDLAFTIPTGTTSSTVAIGNHTHTTTIAAGASSDTNQLTLAFGTKYKLTTGGTNFIFTTPSNPNTDRYVNSASFAHDSTNNNVKMTLTRAGSDTNTVTANIPKVSSSTAGVAPKGATVSSQSQSTKFLREDGTWAAPSYTTNTNTWRNIKVNGTEKLGTGTGTGALDFINGTNTTVSYTTTGKIAINATDTDTKVTQKNSSTNSYRSLLFGCSTIDNENPYDTADITDYVYRSANLYARTSDGALYCTSDINIQSSNLDRDVTPSEEQIGARFSLRDKDNDRCAALYAMNTIDNAKVLVMSAYNNDGTKPNTLKLSVNNDGTCSYYVTSPSAFRQALDYAAYFDGTTTSGRVVITSGTGGKVQASSYTIGKSVPSNAVFTDTDTKVTSVSNHYAPAEDSNANLTASASGATAAWSIDVVKGITLKRDAKGHVVGISVTSGKIPANPNTDEKVKTNLIAPEGEEFPIYYLTATGSTTESAKQLYMNDNAIIRIQTGTASITGRARLVLGNNTAEGAADNCCGQLQLYSTDNGYSVLRQATGVSSTGITIYLPPKAGTIFNTGSLVAGDNITLTESNGVYSINGTANTDTKVTVTETDPTTKTTYYPVWRGAHTTGTGGVLVNEDFKYNSQLGTASAVGQATIILGNSTNSGTAGNKSGQIILFAEKSGYTVLKYKASSTSDTTQTFPDTTGTVLNTGTTSISRSLTSGTKIATLTINGTDTDLYCQTNTDTHRPIKLKGNAYLGNSSTAVDFLQGSNITLSGGTGDNIGKITIAATNNKTSQTEWADAGGTTRPLLVANGWTDSTAGVYYTNDIYCSSTGVLHCTSCNEHSDKRFKDNIEILDNRYLELIKKLQPRRYKFKNDIENKYHIGFITQEIETELSKCNLTKEDFGTLTETGEDKMQSLAYTDFIPMLLLYIKDLERQIKEIKEQQ